MPTTTTTTTTSEKTVRAAQLLASFAASVPHAGHGMTDEDTLRGVTAALERHWPEVEAVLQRAYAHADTAVKLRSKRVRVDDDPLTRALHRSAASVSSGHKGPCGPLVTALMDDWDDRAAALVRGETGKLALGVLAHVLTRLAQSVALVAKHGRDWWERDEASKEPDATIRKDGKALMALLASAGVAAPHSSEPHAGRQQQQHRRAVEAGGVSDEPRPKDGGWYTKGVARAIEAMGIPVIHPGKKNKGTKKDALIAWLSLAGEANAQDLHNALKPEIQEMVTAALAKRRSS